MTHFVRRIESLFAHSFFLLELRYVLLHLLDLRAVSIESTSILCLINHLFLLVWVQYTSIHQRFLSWLSDHLFKLVFALRRMFRCKMLRLVSSYWEDSVIGHLMIVVAILLL